MNLEKLFGFIFQYSELKPEHKQAFLGLAFLAVFGVIIFIQNSSINTLRTECNEEKDLLVRKYDSLILDNIRYLKEVEREAREVLRRANHRESKVKN